MLRVLIGAGVMLMLVGFGAAGWQYWRGQPQNAAAPGAVDADAKGTVQPWLISPSGGIVRREDVQAFLVQDRFVRERMVDVTQTASLDSLLAEGEKLPDTPYLEVLADIRAPKLAEALCPVLTATVAEACAVHSARVEKGSVDPVARTARFTIALAYRLKLPDTPLPDLASHVLRTENVSPYSEGVPPEGEPEAEGEEAPPPLALPASAEAALVEVIRAATGTCAEEDRALTCRLLRVTLDWTAGAVPSASATVSWLAPLPEGVSAVPPLGPPPEG